MYGYGGHGQQIVGWDQIVGAGPSSMGGAYGAYARARGGPLVGAVIPLNNMWGAQHPIGMPVAQNWMPPPQPIAGSLPSGAQPSLVSQAPQGVRQWPLGFGPVLIPNNGTVEVISRPQVLFRPSRFIVPAGGGVSANFSLIDLKIGQRSQFGNANAVPAAVFSEVATDTLFTFDTAQIAQDITITVQNLDTTTSHTFSAVFIGAVID
jgi:hypothetical protein